MRSTLRLVAALLVAVAAGSASPAAAATTGGVGYRVEGVPGSELTAGYLTLNVPAGGAAAGWFVATNSGAATTDVRIYPADGLTAVTSGVVYGGGGAPLADAGAWITPSLRSAAMAAGDERRVDFSVRVPPGARPGDHVGSVVLEQNGRGSSTVQQIVRTVVPIRVVVPGGHPPQLSLRSARIDVLPGTGDPAVVVGLLNTGDRFCVPQLTVSLRGPSERGVAVSRQLDVILPGDRIAFPLPWPRAIKPGAYVARVSSSGCGGADLLQAEIVASELSPGGGTPSGDDTPNGVADPGGTTFRPGRGLSGVAPGATRPGGRRDRAARGRPDVAASTTPPAAAAVPPPSGGGGPQAGVGSGAGVDSSAHHWVEEAVGDAARSVADAAPEIIKRAGFPLLLLLLMMVVFFIQEALDRRDPKLALAPLHREPHLAFDALPLGPQAAVPSSSRLRPTS